MKSINETIDIFINARRYDIMNEGLFFGNRNKNKEKIERSRINEAKEYIKALIDWFESKSNTYHSTYYNAEMFHIGLKIYKISESKFINHIFKSYKKESLINFIGKEDKNKTSNKYGNLIPELKVSEIDKENLIGIIGHDDYEVFIGVNSKKMFEISFDYGEPIIELTNLSKLADKFDEIEEEYIIKADAELGYYKLSQCPEGVEKLKFPI